MRETQSIPETRGSIDVLAVEIFRALLFIVLMSRSSGAGNFVLTSFVAERCVRRYFVRRSARDHFSQLRRQLYFARHIRGIKHARHQIIPASLLHRLIKAAVTEHALTFSGNVAPVRCIRQELERGAYRP